MPSRPIILSTHPLHPAAAALLEKAGELKIAADLAPRTLTAAAREADALIVRAPIPAELFADAPRLLGAVRHGAGLDMIPLGAATAAGVLVANVPGANARSVAEHTVMAALMLLRRLPAIDQAVEAGHWHEARAVAERGREIGGLQVGLVGYGAVGKSVGALMRGLGASVSAFTRHPDAISGAQYRPLEILFGESDIVILACPLTEDTKGLVSRDRLARMKPGALLINVARAGVIDEAALRDALDSDGLGGAALDVFKDQPLGADHPWLRHPKVLATPHMAGLTDTSMAAMGKGAAGEVLRILAGELPVNLVNAEAVPAWRKRLANRN